MGYLQKLLLEPLDKFLIPLFENYTSALFMLSLTHNSSLQHVTLL